MIDNTAKHNEQNVIAKNRNSIFLEEKNLLNFCQRAESRDISD
jgi:hypothetical protein